MRNRLVVALCVAMICMLVGCKKSNDLVGTWVGSMQGATLETEMKPDGKYSSTVSVSAAGQNLVFKYSGTYKIDGKNLTSTVDDIDVSQIPQAMQAMMKQQLQSQAQQNMTGTFEMPDKDTLKITSQGTTFEMKRKK